MADSENSRILPFKTRRNILSAGAALCMTAATKQSYGTSQTSPKDDAPLFALWREWNSAHQRRCELTALQRQLEIKLLDITDESMVAMHIPSAEVPLFASSVEEIEQALPGAATVEARNNAVERLRSLQHEWDITRWELGYTQACEEEVIADRLEWELAEALWRSSANSLGGVVAKLHSMIEMQDPNAFITDNPVPMLRSILDDLIRINI